jgi:hypothetical protein
MRTVKFILGVVVMFVVAAAFTSVSLRAQTSTTSTITGVVSDSTGAVVPNAKVELTDLGTTEKLTTTTGSDGGYTFASVRPGNYRVTVTAKGFRQAVVSGLKVEVGKSSLINLVLEVGVVTETVEVTAGAVMELQTLNASVGNVLDATMLANMPSLSRDATSLMLLQPMATPGFNGAVSGTGENNATGGTVAGARMDQNTFMIDGGDATSNMEGGGGYNTGFAAGPRAVVPTPVESLEEFRVQTNNAGTDFTRSAGGEVQMVTRRGSNDWHGAAYVYHQNDELNANDWFRNLRQKGNPEWRDNRYGGRVGGPIWKNRTFFFLHEEERHFFTPGVVSRLVPTAAEKAGILKFKDASGVVRAYNLNPTATLDPSAGPNDNDPLIGTMLPSSGLDPRAVGVSPAITAEWAREPLPNDFTGGDGLRSANFTGAVPNTTNEHFGVARVDHKINDKWDFMASYRYSTSAIIPPTVQVDIGGVSKGCQIGVPCAIASRPLQPRFLVTGLTGRLTPNLVNEFHFDWLRHWWAWIAPGAHTQVIPTSLSDTPLQIWEESQTLSMVPINVDTQNARQRVWNGQDYTYNDNLSWIRGKHVWTFGGRAQKQNFLHIRDDKVVGGLSTPIYYVAKGGDFSNLNITSAFRPPDCTTTVLINCIPSNQHTNWARAYISALGMVDSGTQVLTRAGDLTPQAFGTNIQQKEIVDSYEISFSDTWRVKPSLTVTYGLTWGVQLPPYDPTGKTAMMVDASSGQLITSDSLLNAKRLEGLSGIVVNPTIAYVPINSLHRKYPYDPDYTNLGPRVAVAWNPSFTDGILGTVLGNHRTVIRGGWSRSFERKNGVGLVLTPALGVGFGDLSVCKVPDRAGNCNLGGDPNTNFRIGVDGNHVNISPLPVVSGGVIIPGLGAGTCTSGALSVPCSPSSANSIYENRDSRLDPRLQVGGSDGIDVSIQRELPGRMILEVGYVGRWSRDLYGNIDLNAVPYMFTPKRLGVNQSFAQAFDAVAGQLQAGAATITPQPWFEAMLGGPTSAFCTGSPSCTAAAVAADGSGFWAGHGAGGVWAELQPNFVTGPLNAGNSQVGGIDWTKSMTSGNYNAAFVTLRSRAYHGVTFDINYTLSHSLDNFGITQECTSTVADAFDVHRNYGPSLFDRRHTFNLLVTYELPFGKGKGMATGAVADRVLGGWSISGVYVVGSGVPDMVYDSAACGTEFGGTTFNSPDTGLIPVKSGIINQTRNNNPTIGPNGYGSNSGPHGAPNMFANPDAVAANFRHATFADATLGYGAIRGPLRWNWDLALAKKTRITERLSTRFDVQFVNAFNHVMFGGGTATYYTNQPGMDVSSPQSFGVPSRQFNSPRYIQVGLRVDF